MESSRPIAYLVTLRTFGTWLHGDARGSHHRLHRTYGTPPLPGRPRLEAVERLQARAPAGLLDARSPAIVERVASAGWWRPGRCLPRPGSGRGTRATRRCTTWCTVKTSSQARFDELNLTAP